jgi:hypothetical protein
MTKKWKEIRGTFTSEEEATITAKMAESERVMEYYAAETAPRLRELAETDPAVYLTHKDAALPLK